MVKVNSTINSFTSGVLSPWLKGRIDIDAYNKGAGQIINCLGRPFGGILRRPGFTYIGETKTTGSTRLIPFVFSITQAFIIELGVGYIRFWKDGSLIETVPDTPYEIVNSFTEDQISNLQFAQTNDVLYLVCDGSIPQKLSRISDVSWSLADLDYTGGPFLLENTTTITLDPSAETGTGITITASDDVFEEDHIGSYWSINNAKVVDGITTQGFVKITGFTSATSVTADVIKDLLDATATNIWAEGAWSDVRGYPKNITFHQGRLWLGNTQTQVQTVWGSEPLIFNNFSLEDGLQRDLPSQQYNFITGLASSRDLAAITYGAPFIIGSGTSSALTAENIEAKQQGRDGGEFLQPVIIGTYIYYIKRGGNKLMEFVYSYEVDGYRTDNISLLSENLLELGIKEMSLQNNEDNILWMIRNDGKIVTVTKETNQKVQSFTLQETDGEYQSVASIPQSDQFWDDVYIVVKRTINGVEKQYVELITKPRGSDITTGNYLDSSLVYDGNKTSELTITGGTATSDEADFASSDVNEYIRINLKDYKITAFIDVNNVTVSTTDEVVTSEWALSKTIFDNLSHLEAKEVSILKDGAVIPPQTVASGSITLRSYGYYVIIGLKYTSTLKTFPLEGGNRSGSSLGNLKRVSYSTLKVIDTMGIEIDGAEFVENVFDRNPLVPMGTPIPLFTGDVRVNIPNDFSIEQTITISQNQPLPMGIVSITNNMSTQEV